MRLLAACSIGGMGHFRPLLPFLEAARCGGHDVLVIAPKELSVAIQNAGLDFHEGGSPSEDDLFILRDRLVTASRSEATIIGNRDLFGRVATQAMLPAMESVFRSWEPDFLLREPCEYASAVVAASKGVSSAQVAISSARGELGSIAAAAPVLEGYRVGLVEELKSTPYLTRFPASMDPTIFASTVRYNETPPNVAGSLPDWWRGSRDPLVYVTLGSVLGHLGIAKRAFEMMLKSAAEMQNVRVLFTTGKGFNVTELGPLPSHVHVEPWVDQDDVLAVASVVVCHAGSGTMLGALATGVPLVGVPFFVDQFDNADSICRLRAGIAIEIPRAADGSLDLSDAASLARRITEAAHHVLATPSYRQAAQAISLELESRLTPDEALARVIEN